MDFELKHLGQTLAIGGFAIYAILYLLRICRERWVPQFFCTQDDENSRPKGLNKRSNNKFETTAIYLSMVLAAGIVVEDISKNIVSWRDDPLTSVLKDKIGKNIKEWLNDWVLDKDSELRFRSLFSVSNDPVDPLQRADIIKRDFLRFRPRGIFWEMTELIHESPHSIGARRAKAVLSLMQDINGGPIYVPGMDEYSELPLYIESAAERKKEASREERDYFVRNEPTDEKKVEQRVADNTRLEEKPVSEIQKFRSAVNEMYYNAKNSVYTQNNYYNELSEIKDRTDFSRSLTLLCFVFFVLYGLFVVMSFNKKLRRLLDVDPKEKKSLVALTTIYFLGIWVVGTAYTSESGHHDRRVFGYYIAMVLDQERTKTNSEAGSLKKSPEVPADGNKTETSPDKSRATAGKPETSPPSSGR
ncbi:hypothetical protein [Prosthecobacter sp.]|uniref:hypothetical protein n=1 Tax=Prosthecobacter sp. TaxID=1965333 RepID=UPI00248795FC|nr:hypothetical protein [Prosthecobacter sp.]MDI1311785.1 hypothetical protein [Prosthecobacter sp.]